jgi:chromosome segregation ATPase
MRVLGFVLVAAVQAAVLTRSAEDMLENPIRRIVNLLQKMTKEVAEEGERDKDLNEKFICYCEKNDGELAASTEELRNKIPQIEASIKEAVSLKEQLDADLARHKSDRQAAKESIDTATKQRQKEADAFAEESGELKSNIAALKKATDAIAKGMSGSFLQSSAANTLRQIAVDNLDLSRYQRDTLTSFLSTSSGYAPASGEILGILRQLQEDMEKELKDVTETENAAITDFEGLVAAKEKEIAAATEAIESKTQRAGETAVQIVSLKNDLEDTKDELGADEVFLMELKKSCASKAKEYEERKANRAQELVAIAETIKILNDDDALDLFKKTLPSPSFMQVSRRGAEVRKEALRLIQKAKSPKFNFLALALEGKKAGFGKVIKMIDDMVVKLGVEQEDDEAQKKWCEAEFDKSEDESKDTKRLIEGLTAKEEETSQAITTLSDDLAALKKSIKDLDQAVTDATEQRKGEHKEYVETTAQNTAAVQLLEVAKNRMNKFYNPALYVKPVRRELTEEERIYVQSGGADPRDAEEAAVAGTGIAGTGIAVFTQLKLKSKDAPPPPPETVDAYAKKDASGPVALIEKLKNDLEKEMQAAEMDEKQSQKDYEEMMADSANQRHTDSKSITEKDAQKADLEGDLQAAKEAKKNAQAEMMALGEYIAKLHGSCDFLLENFDVRKEARASEIDALKKAKAVLSGADYSLLQTVPHQPAFLAKKH